MSEVSRYEQWQKDEQDRWEKLCGRCGACCGVVDGDPCEHLAGDQKGQYYCMIYDNRFGLHRTLSGKPFQCVPIQKILHESWPGDECCGYKIDFRRLHIEK